MPLLREILGVCVVLIMSICNGQGAAGYQNCRRAKQGGSRPGATEASVPGLDSDISPVSKLRMSLTLRFSGEGNLLNRKSMPP